MTGCVSKNTGIYVRAILERPEVSIPGKYAVVHTGAITFPEMLKAWEQGTGKHAVYLAATPEEYNAIWGERFGQQVVLQYQYMANVPDAMIGEPGILSKVDLGITGLGSLEDTFSGLKTEP